MAPVTRLRRSGLARCATGGIAAVVIVLAALAGYVSASSTALQPAPSI